MSLNSTKDFYPCLINALNFLTKNKGKELKSSNQNLETDLINENNNNKEISYKIRYFLNLITKYDFNLSTSYFDFFLFKKSNKYLFKLEKAAELLKLAFLAKGCLISKPIFNIVYPQISILEEENEINLSESKNKSLNKPRIIIHLFYYIKTNRILDDFHPSVRESSKFAAESNNFSVYNDKFNNLNSIDLKVNLTDSFSDRDSNNNNITTIYSDKFTYLCDYLAKLFNTEVELELVRLYRPYQDSNILVQYLNSLSYNRKFIRIVSRLFKKIKIFKRKNFIKVSSLQEHKNINALYTKILNEPVAYPSGISGINIKLAGRPFKERIIPRFTVKRAHRGNFDRLNVKMIERSMFTDKTKKGAFNFTVRLSHIFR
uniref:Small ribosomal subunit protein uS3m n=1 Tax=Inonotus obliquus TaxID=167356 RepID=A0A5A4UDI8_9AGAM|nr:ribosomal protein S3 [Inonotus obliquus]BBN21301.1 ribosomal protein S3 [Inonotus obliquus]